MKKEDGNVSKTKHRRKAFHKKKRAKTLTWEHGIVSFNIMLLLLGAFFLFFGTSVNMYVGIRS